MILAIDPGTRDSAIIGWTGTEVEQNEFVPNAQLAAWLRGFHDDDNAPPLVIEMIESQGMAVGKETFETVYWIGVFAECYGLGKTHRLGRGAVKLHHCNSKRATDSNIRTAILDRFGGEKAAMGRKSAPGPLYGVTSHRMAALALAITWMETQGSANLKMDSARG